MITEDVVAEYAVPVVLVPESTALVIIDLQQASASRHRGLGRLLEAQNRSGEGTYRFERIERLVVPNTAKLLAFFREHGLARIFVRLGAQIEGCRDLGRHIRELEATLGNVEGNPEFEILDELKPWPGEPILTKLSISAFTSTGIDSLLRNLNVNSLVFTGVSTSQCVDLTARDAADRGYGCIIVEDAVAEDRQDFHDATLAQFIRLFGAVLSTDQVLDSLSQQIAVHPPEQVSR